MDKLFRKIFMMENRAKAERRYRNILAVVSILPLFLLWNQSSNGTNNDLFPYMVGSIFSFCVAYLFLGKNPVRYISYINFGFAMVGYTIMMLALIPAAILGNIVSPIELIIDVFMILLPYIIVVFLYKTYKKYLNYKKELSIIN